MTPLEYFSHSLLNAEQDFSSTFMVVNRIKDAMRAGEAAPLDVILQVCERVWATPVYRKQKQAYFLYRSVAGMLGDLMTRTGSEAKTHRQQALDLLLSGIASPHESIRRAAAEGLGALPLAVDKTPPPGGEEDALPLGALPVCDPAWLGARHIQTVNGWTWRGRSFLAPTRSGEILVVKCLRRGEDPIALQREAIWMTRLGRMVPALERTFAVPRPLEHRAGWLVRAIKPPHGRPVATPLHPRRYALAFLAPPDYFHYPNDASPDRRLPEEAIGEVLGCNAWLMGRLMALGIAHTAPIPLFHNRAQRHRREDGGRYRWTHRGRLDRWLASCRHPNFGVSGLRDFEHFTSVAGRPVARYEIIGSHLISLLLVAGSYFRQKAPDRVGCDPSGRPVDARELFDRGLLQSIVAGVWEAYYEGFAGRSPAENRSPIPPSLVDRMIEEMGVDRHMEEILRVVDQEAMSHAMFRSFLQSRGMTATEARLVPKGGADIPLMTGPHLGGFNQPISLPELIDFAAAGAAYCVAGRFRHETSGNR